MILELKFRTEVRVPNKESPVPVAEPVSASVVIEQGIFMYSDGRLAPLAQSHKMTMTQILKGKEGGPLAGKTLDGTNIETRVLKYEELPDREAGEAVP